MPISIDGSGTISGISVGGLENGCINEADLATAAVTQSKIGSNAVTIDKLGTTLQSQVCKAWVNFSGVGTPTVRVSYNVSSITDNGTGDYTINFTTALPTSTYVPISGGGNNAVTNPGANTMFSLTVNGFRLIHWESGASQDISELFAAVFC